MLAHYLINPDMRHNMDVLAETYLNYTPIPITEVIGKKGKNQLSMRDVPLDKKTEYAVEDADITLQLKEHFEKEYLTTQLKKHHGNISKTADFIGMERSALHRKLKSLGIKGIN